jgi:hypothetical protein
MVNLFENTVTNLEDIKKNSTQQRMRSGKAFIAKLQQRFVETCEKNIDVISGKTPAKKGMSHMYNNGRLVAKTGRFPLVLWNEKKKEPIFGWTVDEAGAIEMLKLLIKTAKKGDLDATFYVAEMVRKMRSQKDLVAGNEQEAQAVLLKEGYAEETIVLRSSYAAANEFVRTRIKAKPKSK